MTIKQKKQLWVCLALLLSMPLMAIDAEAIVLAPPQRGQATVTRDVADYTAREQALMAAVVAKGSNATPLLAEDFEAWSTENDWQSKAEWLNAAQHIKTFIIKDVSVRLLDDCVVVQFLLQTEGQKGIRPTNTIVVDIWRQSTQQLSIRYATDTPVHHPSAQLGIKR